MCGEFGMFSRAAGACAGVVAGLALTGAPAALAESALHAAVRAGTLAEVRALLDAGAEVNAFERGKTPLQHAARTRPNPEIVRALLDAGARVDLAGHHGMTALHFAVVNPAPAASLTRPGADATAGPGETARQLEVIRLLLDAGAATHAKNEDGLTPLHLAAGHYWDPEVAGMLLRAGAFVDARAGNDSTPLHFAAAFGGNPSVAELLLDAGADANARDTGGLTPLHLAARFRGYATVAQMLLAAGADVNARDREGKTPLDFHLERDEPGWPEVLRAAGGVCSENC